MVRILLMIILLLSLTSLFSQCPVSGELWSYMDSLTKDPKIPNHQKKSKAQEIVLRFEKCQLKQDSNFIKAMDRLAYIQFIADHDPVACVKTLNKVIQLCQPVDNANTASFAKKIYANYVFYLLDASLLLKAKSYNDTLKNIYNHFSCTPAEISRLHTRNYRIYFLMGDYQKAIDESVIGISNAKKEGLTSEIAVYNNLYAQALYYNSNFKEALIAASNAYNTAVSLEDHNEMATALKLKALIAYYGLHDLKLARALFAQVINERKITNRFDQLSDDYTDFGVMLLGNKETIKESIGCYKEALLNAQIAEDKELEVKAFVNLSQAYWRMADFETAWKYFNSAAEIFRLNSADKMYVNPATDWIGIANTDLLIVMLNNRLELLLTDYKLSRSKKVLDAALRMAATADTVLSLCRRQQVAEQSKLFWRQRTRELYQYALEASYLANNAGLAFYFMEKSRAVLLNDKLNDLTALKTLPASVIQKEHELNLDVVQQKLLLAFNTDNYNTQQVKLVEANNALEQYIKLLEREYPNYYQEKYADEVPKLDELQQYLEKNNQRFVHYFMADTVAYIMLITGSNTTLKKISQPQYDKSAIIEFLQICSHTAQINANYARYLSLSSSIFHTYFRPLSITRGRVIICPDTYLIPYEAIATDDKGDHFLLEDYAFSYVYSARILLINFPLKPSEGNFLGMAPVSFAPYLQLPALRNSSAAATESASFFSNTKLLTGRDATKQSFLNNISRYEVVNVFSHALADSSDTEPAIYMGDSVIYLSELQMLNDISAQLVLLSACQSSVGKNATGEGIYSLARGLAAVGIPAVVATLWEADEETIYVLSNKFNEGISHGLPKDIALQQAKLWYLANFGKEKALPSYWSNMILIGNASPVQFSKHNSYLVLWGLGALSLAIVVFFLFRRSNSKL